jgi:hypothetical protein
MRTIKNNIIKVLFGILILTSFSSCDEGGDPEAGGTTTGTLAGDWYMTLTDSDGALVPRTEHSLHHTYNTSANDNTMWIDDEKHGYNLKCKVTVNVANGTFTAVSEPNLLDSGTFVTITEGKIEKGAGLSKAGHTVDKISFRAHFDYDDDGYDILYEGHKRTGFLEDEY